MNSAAVSLAGLDLDARASTTYAAPAGVARATAPVPVPAFEDQPDEAHAPVTPLQRRVGMALATVIVLIALTAIPFAREPGPVIGAFLPAYISAVLVLDLLTAILFLMQFRLHGRASTLMLACVYLYTGAMVIPHILTFPGVFAPTGLLGAGSQTAVWLWVFWHGGFPLLLLGYAALLRREHKEPEAALPPTPWMPRAIALTLSAVLGLAALTIFAQEHLPVIIAKDNYLALITSGVGPAVLLFNVAALVALWRVTRGRTLTQIWLLNAVLASVLDAAVTLAAGSRYSVGWYVARGNSLLCAGMVLGAFLFEFHRLQVMLASANRRLAALADTDALTGLGNRRAFDRKLGQEWLRAARGNESVGLLLLDVDQFKAYNDTYGHPAGDACLRVVGLALRGSLHRPSDFAARYGGEEMAVILPDTDLDGALHVAEAVRAAIEALGMEHKTAQHGKVTVSVGVATGSSVTGNSVAELVGRADAALYRAKEGGRNQARADRQGRPDSLAALHS